MTIQRVDTTRFTYDKRTRTFSVERSDLLDVYPRSVAVPYTIDLVSSRTGQVRRHDIVEQVTRDQEVVAWAYRNAEEDTRLVMFND